jgi:hypothetical protein
MKLRAGLIVVGLALLLAGCDDLDAGLFGDGEAPVATGPSPQAPQFCTARGYQPGTDAFQRCVVSVEENLRKGGDVGNGAYPH